MKRLIAGKIRDSEILTGICGYSQNPNDCYSTFGKLLIDERDKKLFIFSGNHWGGLGPDTLQLIDAPAAVVFVEGIDLSDEEISALTKHGIIKE